MPYVLVEDFKSGIMNKQQFAETSISDIFKNFKVGGADSTMDNILTSKTPGFSNLWENLTKGDGLKGGMDELQSAMMLPMLLQMMIGGEY